MFIRELLWDTSATHLPTPEVVMENIVRRAVTHIEFNGNFISSDLPVVMDLLLDLLFHRLSCHANWPPIPVFISDFFSSIVKYFCSLWFEHKLGEQSVPVYKKLVQ